MNKKMTFWRGITSVFAILTVFCMLMTSLLVMWKGQVNVALNVSAPIVEVDEDNAVFGSAYGLSDEGLEAMLLDSDAHDIQTMAEGAVLLKNNDGTLPLAENEKRITLFGRAAADPVYRGNSGGPSYDENRKVSLHDALTQEGFEINETLYNAYLESDVTRVKGDPDWSIGEVDASFYTDEIKQSWQQDYNDAAIIVLSRDGGEGKDLVTEDVDGISYLALHDTEKELLSMVRDSGLFEKTIVLINSAYPMELDWAVGDEYGIDAMLWIGTPGLKGFCGVAELLSGKVAPSGRLVDSYATNSLSAPATQNAGDFTFSNNSEHYIVEAEGIYVGYKYYESRYYDQILGIHNATSQAGTFASSGNWDYASEVTYPFGYGMTYGDFSEELLSLEWDRTAHTVTAEVNVTNQGYPEAYAYGGKEKDVVELYVSLPYVEGGAEKSAITLIGFAKTDDLAAGESQKVEIVADDYLFATYDSNAVNGADSSKQGCYVFDPGDYVFAIGKDCHDATNNVLASLGRTGMVSSNGEAVEGNPLLTTTVTLDALDNTTYAISRETGEVVSNRFEDIDYNYFKSDSVGYLTRSDWTTFPMSYTDMEATEEMVAQMTDTTWETPKDSPKYDSFQMEKDSGLTLADMKEVEYTDEKWDQFIDQLSLKDLTSILGENFGQSAVQSVGKPENHNSDGPAGPQGNYQYGEKGSSTVHVGECVAASTWDIDLLNARGQFIGEDCLFVGTTQLWSPGADLHRTPFSGRNFEYYSEDSNLSYLLAAAQCAGMQQKGVNTAIKHFCGNDQETNRMGLCIFMTEQAYRQGPLRGFEGAFTKGGALATMLSCSRIGCRYMYQSQATLTGVLRDEWGFCGVTITDSVKGIDIPTLACFIAGSDTFNADTNRTTEVLKYMVSNQDGYVLSRLRETNKRFYYAMAHSNIMNSASADGGVNDFVPWWQWALRILGVALALFTLASLYMFLKNVTWKKKLVITTPMYFGEAVAVISAVSAVIFIVMDRSDRTFSPVTVLLLLLGAVSWLLALVVKKDLVPLVATVFLGAGLSVHLYQGLPTLSDIWNGVNFIGGNPIMVVVFGVVFGIVTILSVISLFLNLYEESAQLEVQKSMK